MVGEDGDLITEAAYSLLNEAERGAILFLRQTADGLAAVSGRAEYDDLPPAEQGPIRYFRKLRGGGAQSPFDALGDTLTRATYRALPRAERGAILGQGPLIHLRFAAAIFRNGTTFKPFVRHSAAGTDGNLWQQVEPGDATALTDSRQLTLSIPVGRASPRRPELSPQPIYAQRRRDQRRTDHCVFHLSSDPSAPSKSAPLLTGRTPDKGKQHPSGRRPPANPLGRPRCGWPDRAARTLYMPD